jgi:hypothetical protein
MESTSVLIHVFAVTEHRAEVRVKKTVALFARSMGVEQVWRAPLTGFRFPQEPNLGVPEFVGDELPR